MRTTWADVEFTTSQGVVHALAKVDLSKCPAGNHSATANPPAVFDPPSLPCSNIQLSEAVCSNQHLLSPGTASLVQLPAYYAGCRGSDRSRRSCSS